MNAMCYGSDAVIYVLVNVTQAVSFVVGGWLATNALSVPFQGSSVTVIHLVAPYFHVRSISYFHGYG